MADLKEIKNRISSVTATRQLTKAMKMVAAAKLRKSQDRAVQMRFFCEKIFKILHNLMGATDVFNHFSHHPKNNNKVLIIIISSDRGLCGSFNVNLAKYVLSHIEKKYNDKEVTIMPIGKKAFEYFRKRDYLLEANYWQCLHEMSFEKSSQIADVLLQMFQNNQYGFIDVVYNEFKNVATQILRVKQFLPFSLEAHIPVTQEVDNYISQPNANDVLQELVPRTLKALLYSAVSESIASENGARMTAMDQATDNATELLKELKLTYNRTRQAAITKEILEIVGGAEALKDA